MSGQPCAALTPSPSALAVPKGASEPSGGHKPVAGKLSGPAGTARTRGEECSVAPSRWFQREPCGGMCEP